MGRNELLKLVNECLEWCVCVKNFQPKTIRNKKNFFLRLTRFLGNSDFNIESLSRYRKHLYDRGWQPISLACELKQAKAFVSWCSSHGNLEDWSSKIELPKVNKKTYDIVDVETAEKIIIAGTENTTRSHVLHRKSKREHRLCLRFVLMTGLRNHEVCTLKGSDIDFENQTFRVHSKGGNEAILPLPRPMVKILSKRRHKDPLFNVNAKKLNESLQSGCKKLGIEKNIRCHSLRRIFATELGKNGVPLVQVQRLLRHSSPNITSNIYTVVGVEDMRTAVNNAHPMMYKDRSVKQVFEDIERKVHETHLDERFKISVSKTSDEFVLKIRNISNIN